MEIINKNNLSFQVGSKTIKISQTLLHGKKMWNDDIEFDDFSEFPNLPLYRIEKIEIWNSFNFSSTSEIKGFQITYKELSTNKTFKTNLRKGTVSDTTSRVSEIHLKEDEYIEEVTTRSGWVVDNITIKTNKTAPITVGGQGGDYKRFQINKDRVVIGTFGAYGTHLYRIGFYHISKEDYYFIFINNSKLSLFLINTRMKGKKEQLESLIKDLGLKSKETKGDEFKSPLTLARVINEMPKVATLMIISFY
jgi:hypothetical protein